MKNEQVSFYFHRLLITFKFLFFFFLFFFFFFLWAQFILKPLENEPLFVNLTMQDIVFGYNDSLLEKIYNIEKSLADLNISIGPLQDPHFQLQTNDTLSAQTRWSAIYTGKGDLSKLGQFVEWQGMNGTLSSAPNWTGCPSTQESYNVAVGEAPRTKEEGGKNVKRKKERKKEGKRRKKKEN
jgi:hypothetical protein